jgi:hypothetical protein
MNNPKTFRYVTNRALTPHRSTKTPAQPGAPAAKHSKRDSTGYEADTCWLCRHAPIATFGSVAENTMVSPPFPARADGWAIASRDKEEGR